MKNVLILSILLVFTVSCQAEQTTTEVTANEPVVSKIATTELSSKLSMGEVNTILSLKDYPEMHFLAKQSGCTACHEISKKVVGPPWASVSERYLGDDGAKDRLVAKVKAGGKGNWTEITHGVPMPPYSPRVSDNNIERLVDFVLSLAKDEI